MAFIVNFPGFAKNVDAPLLIMVYQSTGRLWLQ